MESISLKNYLGIGLQNKNSRYYLQVNNYFAYMLMGLGALGFLYLIKGAQKAINRAK